jgi:hypothetical protein
VESALNIQKLKPQIDAIKAQVGAADAGFQEKAATPGFQQVALLPRSRPPPIHLNISLPRSYGPFVLHTTLTVCMYRLQYGEDKDAISRETSALYEKAGVDPLAGARLPPPARQGSTGLVGWPVNPSFVLPVLPWRSAPVQLQSCPGPCRLLLRAALACCAGCLPSLATIPIFIGLFRSLSDFASQEEAGSAAFYWIPSLAGPTSMGSGSGTAWLLPLVDGAPPIGWDMATRYLALPIALVIVQVRAGRRCADAMRHEYRQRGRQGLDCVRVARGARR